MATRRRISPQQATATQSRSAQRTSAPTEPHKPEPTELVKLVAGTELISVDIPTNATLHEVEATLVLAVDGFRRLNEAAERIKPIIGRILLTISSRRLWRTAEKPYKNFTEYVEDVVVDKMSLGRTFTFQALRIARAFPGLTAEDYQRYGASRLLIAASVTDENDPKYKEILDQSLAVPVATFERTVNEAKSASKEAATASEETQVLSLRLSKDVKKQWDDLLHSSEMSGPELFTEMLAMYLETEGMEGETEAPASETPRKPVVSAADIAAQLRAAMGGSK